jgi:hypothetical protein
VGASVGVGIQVRDTCPELSGNLRACCKESDDIGTPRPSRTHWAGSRLGELAPSKNTSGFFFPGISSRQFSAVGLVGGLFQQTTVPSDVMFMMSSPEGTRIAAQLICRLCNTEKGPCKRDNLSDDLRFSTESSTESSTKLPRPCFTGPSAFGR